MTPRIIGFTAHGVGEFDRVFHGSISGLKVLKERPVNFGGGVLSDAIVRLTIGEDGESPIGARGKRLGAACEPARKGSQALLTCRITTATITTPCAYLLDSKLTTCPRINVVVGFDARLQAAISHEIGQCVHGLKKERKALRTETVSGQTVAAGTIRPTGQRLCKQQTAADLEKPGKP
jgi:hypothetical protein